VAFFVEEKKEEKQEEKKEKSEGRYSNTGVVKVGIPSVSKGVP